ncbi:MAG TPA: hypothetical protein VL025_12105 [Thermoanaerobaculia bacterium]|nr:hypothetical protein [Thermoanaerobaculia bacterium]
MDALLRDLRHAVRSALRRPGLTVVVVETVPEPLVLATVALVLFGVGGLASWYPARRAARIDPLMAIRQR